MDGKGEIPEKKVGKVAKPLCVLPDDHHTDFDRAAVPHEMVNASDGFLKRTPSTSLTAWLKRYG